MHAVLLLFRPSPNVGIKNFGMWGMYDLAKAYRNMQKSIANRRVEDWEASNGRTKDTTQLFHGPWHDPVGEHICAQPFRMWNRLRSHPFFAGLTNISKTQSDANKQDFENMLNFTCQAQSIPKTTGILTLKRLGHFFQNVILFSNVVHYKCNIFHMKLVQYNECLISILDADGLVL